jgi:FixJ family two-component response regulator
VSTESAPKILVVDDEEAILETMMFTFQDDYEVFTSTDARKGLDILDAEAPIAVVLSDQRMPEMSGVEFVTEVCKRHPTTTRMILTGFSDMEATLSAINDGHVYAYITKPWEPDQLKQVMKQAVDHHRLALENERLLADVTKANSFLGAVIDQLDTGAIAVDAAGVIQAVNRPVQEFLGLSEDVRGQPLAEHLEARGLHAIGGAAVEAAGEGDVRYFEVEFQAQRFRVTSRSLTGERDETLGRVILIREISHEPLRLRFDDLVNSIESASGGLRPELERVQGELSALEREVGASQIHSGGMTELMERITRTRTALQHWLDVDSAMAREDFPDAKGLQDRMRIASARWPRSGELPGRIALLAQAVADYYESGEKAKQPIL